MPVRPTSVPSESVWCVGQSSAQALAEKAGRTAIARSCRRREARAPARSDGGNRRSLPPATVVVGTTDVFPAGYGLEFFEFRTDLRKSLLRCRGTFKLGDRTRRTN